MTANARHAYDAENRLSTAAGGLSVGGSSYWYNGGEPSTTGGTSYLTQDTLGSTRAVTSQGQEVRGRYDFLPFGEEVYVGRTGYGGDSVRQKFTGKERDDETGLDYFEARYYSGAQGRFTSTDPIVMAPERALDPQQINLYVYTRNNPLRLVDPDGEIINEPTDLSEKEQQRYDAWKKKLLSTKEGQKLWAK